MQVNYIFAEMVEELAESFENHGLNGPRNAAMIVYEKMRRMNVIAYPATTLHRKCDECGCEMRNHGYIAETNKPVCPVCA